MKYRKMDLYEYFLRRSSLNIDTLNLLWGITAVQKIIALYMWAGLPLSAAIVYLAHALKDQCLPSTQQHLFTAGLPVSSQLKGQKKAIRTISQGGHLVKQLCRMVDQRLDGHIPGFPEKRLDLGSVDYPNPLLDTSTSNLTEWLFEEGYSVLCDTPNKPWRKSDDYEEYLTYWTKAYWDIYSELSSDQTILSLAKPDPYDQRDPLDSYFEYEAGWKTFTPNLNTELRIKLMVTVAAEINLGIIIEE
jgi:hypothetical protein